MNQFTSIDSGQGLLKNDYGDTPVNEALKRRIKKIKEKIQVPTKQELEDSEDDDNT